MAVHIYVGLQLAINWKLLLHLKLIWLAEHQHFWNMIAENLERIIMPAFQSGAGLQLLCSSLYHNS